MTGVPGGRRNNRAVAAVSREPFFRRTCWFVAVGAAATGLNAVLFLLLRQWWDLVTANVVALALSTVASTEANRLLTFAGTSATRTRLDIQSLLVFLFYCFYNTVTLWALHFAVADATRETEALTLTVASVLGGSGRFLLLRLWVFERIRAAGQEHQRMSPLPVTVRSAGGNDQP